MKFKFSKKILSFIVVVLFLSGLGFFLSSYNHSTKKIEENNIKYVKIAGEKLKVDLALTLVEQEQGLSGRKILAPDEGMLFVFSKPSVNYFWMKDMNFPIDMIWLDENLKVIYLKKEAQPESYPETFGPGVDNSYVLEVSAGFSEKNNLKEGDSIEFLY